MGFARNLGAALTMGLTANTKQKHVEGEHKKRAVAHERAVGAFNAIYQQTGEKIEALEATYQSAWDALIRSRAMGIDDDGNLTSGWYQPVSSFTADDVDPDPRKALVRSLPAFGVALGAPIAAWTLVGAFGTAATGTAISALSGAAAGAATAAWIGRAATLGTAGMTAGRFALGPIALISIPVQLGIGYWVSGKRAKNAELQYAEQSRQMAKREDCMSHFKHDLLQQGQDANRIIASLHRHTDQLERADPESDEARLAANRMETDMREAVALRLQFSQTNDEIQTKLSSDEESNSDGIPKTP